MEPDPARISPIAIIGIGCIFPKSPTAKGFWRLIVHGHDAITDVPPTHWSPDDYFDPDPKRRIVFTAKEAGFYPPSISIPRNSAFRPRFWRPRTALRCWGW